MPRKDAAGFFAGWLGWNSPRDLCLANEMRLWSRFLSLDACRHRLLYDACLCLMLGCDIADTDIA